MQYGVNRVTGKRLTGFDHLKQSIGDILSTPIGTRVMRREYGSNLWKLIDRPMNAEFVSNFIQETAIALYRWEPRVRLLKAKFDYSEWNQGNAALDCTLLYLPNGREITLDGILLNVSVPQ